MGNISASVEYNKKEFKQHKKKLSNSQEPILLLQPSNKIIFTNKSAQQLFWIGSRKNKNKTIFSISSKYQPQQKSNTTFAVKKVKEETLKAGGSHSFEWNFIKNNGIKFSSKVTLMYLRSNSQAYGQLKLDNKQANDKRAPRTRSRVFASRKPKRAKSLGRVGLVKGNYNKAVLSPKANISAKNKGSLTPKNTTTKKKILLNSSTKKNTTKSNKKPIKKNKKSLTNKKTKGVNKKTKNKNNTKKKNKKAKNKKKTTASPILKKSEQDFLSDLLSIPQKQTSQKNQSTNSDSIESSAFSVSSTIYDSQDDNLNVSTDVHNLKITKLVERIQNKVENSESNHLKKKIDNCLREVYDIFCEAIEDRDKQINNLTEKIKSEKKKHNKKFENLESHLQRRLTGLQSEKETKKQMMEENLLYRRNSNEFEELLNKQNQSISRLSKITKECVEFREVMRKKHTTFLDALYRTSGSDDSDDSDESVHNYDSETDGSISDDD
ncbi:hypothetical protein M0813_01353 [Anaeramoeba flamelloides]|uniref:Uncharacterized protein n=1 Tax=Anaeramoeba flamelloides TaxID=1746091 RepID=A0AAV7YQ59_9EUKA|nr:hypothetical protein M0812_20835 [Anaeramoeba flamelloides]KAJ6253307.1 hypothetical protein M0813_01353 [Anaeramoeba flamelloides]